MEMASGCLTTFVNQTLDSKIFHVGNNVLQVVRLFVKSLTMFRKLELSINNVVCNQALVMQPEVDSAAAGGEFANALDHVERAQQPLVTALKQDQTSAVRAAINELLVQLLDLLRRVLALEVGRILALKLLEPATNSADTGLGDFAMEFVHDGAKKNG